MSKVLGLKTVKKHLINITFELEYFPENYRTRFFNYTGLVSGKEEGNKVRINPIKVFKNRFGFDPARTPLERIKLFIY